MIKVFKYILLIAAFGAINQSSFAQPEGYTKLSDPQKFESDLKKVSAELNSIKADFVQTKQMQFLDTELKSGGKFWFKNPDKVRWEYTSPYTYTVIINEGKLNLISEDSENEFDMSSSEVFQQVNELMLAAVSGNIFSNSQYNTKGFESSKFYLVLLTPETDHVSELIKTIELYFDKNSLRVVQMRMVEPNSDFSLITFTNQLINEIIEDNTFKP